MNFDDALNKVLDHLKTVAKTETVIGEQFTLGEFTCVPVIKISMGIGSGSGTGESEKTGKGTGGGVGGGTNIEPIAFLVAKGDEISLMAVNKKKGLSGIFEKVPDMMEKMMQMKEKENKKE